jgi:hypothetical protein
VGQYWHVVLAAVCALAASLLFATGSALLHRASGVSRVEGPSARALAEFARSVARHPGWLVALLVEALGFAFHAIALHEGTLVLVQPLLATTLVFALVVRRRLDRGVVVPAEVWWAGLLVVALAVFLLTVSPLDARPQAPDPIPTALVTGLASLAFVAALAGSSRWPGRRPMLLGLAAGICSAATAALVKTAGNVLTSRGVLTMVGHWSFWAALVAGATGIALTQLAFQAGPLSASLPSMQTANPVLSVVIGTSIYDEPFRQSPVYIVAAVAGLVATLVAVAALSRLVSTSAAVPAAGPIGPVDAPAVPAGPRPRAVAPGPEAGSATSADLGSAFQVPGPGVQLPEGLLEGGDPLVEGQ